MPRTALPTARPCAECRFCLDAIARLNVPRPPERARPPAREPLAVLVPDGGGAQYRVVMAAPGSEEHRERARRAQQLSDRARSRPVASRSCRTHRAADGRRTTRACASCTGRPPPHRQAWHQYEEAAQLQQLHAEHERSAAERAVAMETAGGGDLGATADRRDSVADERDPSRTFVREPPANASAARANASSWRTSVNGGKTAASVVSTKRPAVGRRASAISWPRPRAPWVGWGRGWDGMTRAEPRRCPRQSRSGGHRSRERGNRPQRPPPENRPCDEPGEESM